MTYQEALTIILKIKSDYFNSNWAALSNCDIVDGVLYQYLGTDEDGKEVCDIIAEDTVIRWVEQS